MSSLYFAVSLRRAALRIRYTRTVVVPSAGTGPSKRLPSVEPMKTASPWLPGGSTLK